MSAWWILKNLPVFAPSVLRTGNRTAATVSSSAMGSTERSLPSALSPAIAASTAGSLASGVSSVGDSVVCLVSSTDRDGGVNEDSSIDLFIRTLYSNSNSLAQRPTRLQILKYTEELSLLDKLNQSLRWDVSEHTVHDFTELPLKRNHSGDGVFSWIGQQGDGLPQWLWDSESWKTVPATPEMLKQGYIAVSWTWGRYQRKDPAGRKIFRQTSGTPWLVPKLPNVTSRQGHVTRQIDLLTHLKRILRHIPAARYFWVDLLCIDQADGNKSEMDREIAKQASIFRAAKGSIAFLWALEDQKQPYLGKAISALGALLAWTFAFGPHTDVKLFPVVDHNKTKSNGPDVVEWTELFKRLRDNNWFTSLWALQELVLSPAAVWMDVDGSFFKINNRILTTRLFATTVRTLFLADACREEQWKVTEQSYKQLKRINSLEFSTMKESTEAEDYKVSRALQEAMENQGMDGLGYCDLVIETESERRSGVPWVFARHLRDRPMQDKVRQWIDWAFGTACVDLAIQSTRAAILLAARNRNIADNRSAEIALFAALKIQHHDDFLSKDLLESERRGVSTNLLNVILAKEGVQIFNVKHRTIGAPGAPRPADHAGSIPFVTLDSEISYYHLHETGGVVSRSPGITDITRWTLVNSATDRQEVYSEYRRNGRIRYIPILRPRHLLLTGMSPCTGSRVDPQLFHYEEHDIVWEAKTGWHMHERGDLHIPSTARIQVIEKRPDDETNFTFRPNGSIVDYAIERFSDEKLIWQTQPWLEEKLGKGKPQIILLPLGVHIPTSQARITSGSGPVERVKKPTAFGVLLVARDSVRKDVSMTRWYKFGTYHGWGPFANRMEWKDGIIVSAMADEPVNESHSIVDCYEHSSRAQDILASIEPSTGGAVGWEFIRHDELRT